MAGNSGIPDLFQYLENSKLEDMFFQSDPDFSQSGLELFAVGKFLHPPFHPILGIHSIYEM